MRQIQGIMADTKNTQTSNADDVPQITFDEQAGFLRIEGDSYYEYAVEVFEPILHKLSTFIAMKPTRKLEAEFCMTYFNTSTSRRFFEIFKLLEAYHQQGGKVYVEWYYKNEDTDTLDSGMEFASQVSFNFQCIPLLEL